MSVEETPAPTAPMLTSGPPEAEAGGVLTIDLGAIEANWQMLRKLVTPAECAAVVKGDAYGCGLEPVATVLQRAGCNTFFVADLFEAKRLRRVVPQATIYVLNGFPPGTGAVFAEHFLSPVIGSLAELAEWELFCDSGRWNGGMALHVDTGMNRLGITPGDAAGIAQRLQTPNHNIALVMSHFVASEIPDHPMNAKQTQEFRDIRLLFRGVPSSLANSSGIFLGAPAYCDLVRPGVALYGANPTPGKPNPMRPVIELKGRVVQTRNIAAGETVGYGATWRAKRNSRIAIVSLGYADGFPRAASATDDKPGGQALVAGRLCPFAGRVSMDLLAVDVTDVYAVRRGEFITLIGKGNDIDTVAGRAGMISYELMTSLGRRYARRYRNTPPQH